MEIKNNIWEELGKTDFTPERMRDIPFVAIDAILGKKLTVEDYEIFVSKDLNKYSSGNEMGVHVIFEDDDGDKVRICTHARAIVKAIKTIDDKKLNLKTLPATTIKAGKTERGGIMYSFD